MCDSRKIRKRGEHSTPKHVYYYNQSLHEKALDFINSIFLSIRKDIMPEGSYPWQEVCLFLDCLIKCHVELKSDSEMDGDAIYSKLQDLYKHSYKDAFDEVFKAYGLYTITSFETLLNELYNKKVLQKTFSLFINEIYPQPKELNENDPDYLDDLLDSFGPSPAAKIKVLMDYNCPSHIPTLCVTKNSNNDFFVIVWDWVMPSKWTLDNYDESDPFCSNARKYNEASCIWPFYDGYARIISKAGKWGFISEETKMIKYIIDDVLYADDFSCERCRVQLNDSSSSYKYLGLCLEDCFKKKFRNASNFKDGYAVVSDEFCDDYRIDVFGNIVEEDKSRYKMCKERRIESDKKAKKLMYDAIQRNRKSKMKVSYDEESAIMDALSGQGADPEIFGF